MFGNIYIPGYTRRALAQGWRDVAEYMRSGPHAEAHAEAVIEASLPDLTLVSPEDAAILRCMVYGVSA